MPVVHIYVHWRGGEEREREREGREGRGGGREREGGEGGKGREGTNSMLHCHALALSVVTTMVSHHMAFLYL